MTRRLAIAGLALAGPKVGAQERPGETLYIPQPHLVKDRKLLHDFMDEFAFVDLVTAAPAIRITHIPALLRRDAGKHGTVFGHISRQNPQRAALESREQGMIVFRGPHSYISPSWYAKTEAVPTWNFAVVHASGKLKPITDKKALQGLLAQLIQKFDQSTYDFHKLPESYVDGMVGGIIGFEMEIELLEGKFKLGQERSAADQAGILQNLPEVKRERSMHDFTASFYEWKKNSG
jgi:transcriptional regulator